MECPELHLLAQLRSSAKSLAEIEETSWAKGVNKVSDKESDQIYARKYGPVMTDFLFLVILCCDFGRLIKDLTHVTKYESRSRSPRFNKILISCP